MLKCSKTSIRKIIIIPLGFFLILFLSKPSLSSEDVSLLALNIECSGKNNDWSKSFSDNFFAISNPYTLQGSRYWIARGVDEGDKKYDGDIGQNIFIGTKTKKNFRIMGEGTWLKNKDDVFKFKFLSKGNKSIIKHLSEGVEGTGGKGKHKRECKIKLLSQVDAFDGIRVDKYLSVRDKKIKKLLSEINDYKNIEGKISINNQELDVSQLQTNGEEIQKLTKKYEKEITLLKNQISTLSKEKNTSVNEILRLTNELEGNDIELDYKSKFDELSSQFENLNDEYKNITKINEQLDNEITSLKNELDKKNITEKEDKKIVQQKNENTTSEENQKNDNKNVESVSVDSEIVKEVNFDTGTNYENCGVAKVKIVFYSDSKFELAWSCPEKIEPLLRTGTWKNLSKNSNTLNHLSTIYAHNGVEYKDIIKINDSSINISWNGGEENEYRFVVKRISNENPEDLTGNWLTCEGKNIIHDETLAIQFISKKKVRYAYVKYGLDASEPYIIILNKGEDLKYEVNDKYIVIKTKPMIDHTWGNGDKEKGFTLIDRDDLTINQNLLGKNHKYWKGMDIYPYPTKPQCYLVDAEKENPFGKFENINLKQEDKKEKKL